LVTVSGSGSSLVMSGSAKITGNTNTNSIPYNTSGGVYLENAGHVTMNDSAEISYNTANYQGGGVLVTTGGILIMHGGTIAYNKNVLSGGSGGGVYIYDNTSELILDGNALITRNHGGGNGGGGVTVHGGIFSMGGNAKITYNTSANSGGGVAILGGAMTMNDDAEISHNECDGNGSGVYGGGGYFTMNDRTKISSNKANNDTGGRGRGGGVFNTLLGFTMNGGTVWGAANTTPPPGLTQAELNANANIAAVSDAAMRYGEVRFPNGGYVGADAKTAGEIHSGNTDLTLYAP
jgi:hypothetical protein